jgi:hypothetical protein
LAQTAALSQFSEIEFFLFELVLENSKFLFKLLIFVLSATTELSNGDFKLLVHAVLLAFDAFEFFVEFFAGIFDFGVLLLEVLQAALSIRECHSVLVVSLHTFLQSFGFILGLSKRLFKLLHFTFQILDDLSVGLDVLLDLAKTFFQSFDEF